MSKKYLITFSAVISVIFSAQAFAMMGSGNGQMPGQQHHQAMTSGDHDMDTRAGIQAGDHVSGAGQGTLEQNGGRTRHRQGGADHDTMDHQDMDEVQINRDAEDFFRE